MLGVSSLGLGRRWGGGRAGGGPPVGPSHPAQYLPPSPGPCVVGKGDLPNLSQSRPDHPQTLYHCLLNRAL